jgi:hypothetical protein
VENQLNYRRFSLIAFCVLAVISFALWFWHFYTTGKIIITTNNSNNTISLVKSADSDEASAKKYTARGNLTLNLPAGNYTLSVEGNSIATNQVIKVKGHKTQSYNINPVNTSGVEPVVSQPAQNLTISSSELDYLNSNTGILFKVDSQNNVVKLAAQQFKVIKWASQGTGVGQGEDGNLYIVNGGTINQLNLPFAYKGEASGFSISPSKNIYVSDGADVYAGNLGGNFKKIYTANSTSPVIVAGLNKVAVADEVIQSTSTVDPLLAVISTSGKTIKKGESAGKLFWSPGGKYLISTDEDSAKIYNDSLNLVGTIASKTFVEQVAWVNDNMLFYTSNDQVWSYDITSNKAQLTANMPLADSITELTINPDKSYIYLVTHNNSGDNYAIRRVGLQNQQVQNFLYQLQDILPRTLNNSTLSLVNFGQPPTVVVTPFPDSDASSQAILQEGQTELQQDGFDLSKLRIQLGSN